jgi:TonB family protein
MKIVTAIVISTLLCACSSSRPTIQQGEQTNKAQLKPEVVGEPQSDVQASLIPLDFTNKMNRHETNKYWRLNKRIWLNIPYLIIKLGTTGCVSVSFTINHEGKPQTPKISFSHPVGVFDQAAIEAINKRRWTATKENQIKQPVKTSTVFAVGVKSEAFKQYCQNI